MSPTPSPSNADLQNQINLLTARLNQIDGQGLTLPDIGAIPDLTNDYNGLYNTLNQVALAIQSLMAPLQVQVNSMQSLLYAHLGLPAPS